MMKKPEGRNSHLIPTEELKRLLDPIFTGICKCGSALEMEKGYRELFIACINSKCDFRMSMLYASQKSATNKVNKIRKLWKKHTEKLKL